MLGWGVRVKVKRGLPSPWHQRCPPALSPQIDRCCFCLVPVACGAIVMAKEANTERCWMRGLGSRLKLGQKKKAAGFPPLFHPTVPNIHTQIPGVAGPT